jgi:F0F1-type ATP synthase membrane subunit c/vacuolar-type H+-ATPase subunit K
MTIPLVLLFALCIIVPSALFGLIARQSIDMLGRYPVFAPRTFTSMIVKMVLVEAAAIALMVTVYKIS